MPADKQASTQGSLQQFKTACGCAMGKHFMLAGMLSFILYAVYYGAHGQVSLINELFILIYFLFCFAIIGKAVGLIVAFLFFIKTRTVKNKKMV